VLLPLLYSASEGAATGAGYKTGVTSAIVRKGVHRIGCRLWSGCAGVWAGAGAECIRR